MERAVSTISIIYIILFWFAFVNIFCEMTLSNSLKERAFLVLLNDKAVLSKSY